MFKIGIMALILFASFCQTVFAQAADVPVVPTNGPITLRWAAPGNPSELAVYQQIADNFMAANEQITVELVSSDFERTLTTLAGGTAPDIIFFTIDSWPGVAGRGVLEPLDAYIERDDFDLNDFYPQIIEPYRFDGETFGQGPLYGLPKEIAIRAFYYNIDLWEQAGLQLPDAEEPLSWDEFRQNMAALTVKRGPRTVQYGLVSDAWSGMWSIWIWANGGRFVDDPYQPTQAFLDEPEAIEAMEWFVSMATEDGIMAPPAATAEQGANDIFLGQRAATFYSGRWQVPSYRDANLNFDVMPTPSGPGGVAQLLTGSIFGISAASQQKDAAWALLSYITGEAAQTEMTELGLLLPSRRSVAESATFLQAEGLPENNQVFLNDLQYARPLPLTRDYPQIEDIWSAEMQLALSGEKSVEAAMKAANEAINAILAR